MLATVRRDGRPHVVPIWFVLDGDDLVFNTGTTSVKAAAMRRDPRVSIAVDEATPPYAFVTVAGTVTISEDRNELIKWATAIGRRYMGQARAEEFGRRNGVPGELLIRVTPVKIVAYSGVAD
jgi:PPOX class probable F420-dependent enzyme